MRSWCVNINGSEYVSTRYGAQTIKLADYVFTWGKFDYKNLSSKYPKLKNKIINTGIHELTIGERF